jgi:hypothetical protein
MLRELSPFSFLKGECHGSSGEGESRQRNNMVLYRKREIVLCDCRRDGCRR